MKESESTKTYIWYELKGFSKEVPLWVRTIGVDDEGKCWFPGEEFGTRLDVFMRASLHGVPSLLIGEHAYYPADWLRQECPARAEVIDLVIDVIMKSRAQA